MRKETSKAVEEKSGSVFGRKRRKRTPAYIQIVPDLQCPAGDALDFLGAEFGDNGTPLADGGGADAQRPRDVRGFLKVIENFAFEHDSSLSLLKRKAQARFRIADLTSVHMDKLNDLAGRLSDAMKASEINASELAQECRVSSAAVTHWLNGTTKKLTADNYQAAARALGVREEWLRTGKLPRERDSEQAQVEKVQSALRDLREPLAALLAAIDEFSPSGSTKKRRTGG
jgi:transcriptional regulator with XRE-family HTH domain